MGVMIVTVVVVAVLTLIGTVVWWAMMNDWEAKDRAARGRHVTERRGGDATTDKQDDDSDGPVVVKL
jgi:hypothetical protein